MVTTVNPQTSARSHLGQKSESNPQTEKYISVIMDSKIYKISTVHDNGE